jgi:hypothetical protein
MDAGDAHAKSDMYHLEDEVKQELARLDTVLLERNDAVAGTMTPLPSPLQIFVGALLLCSHVHSLLSRRRADADDARRHAGCHVR